jgi:hypothetical protein
MANFEAQEAVKKLLNCKAEFGKKYSYKIIKDSGMKILFDFANLKSENTLEKEAYILYSLIVLKCESIFTLSGGKAHKNSINNVETRITFDPFSIWPIVRSQFEAYCTFYLIFIQPKEDNERQLFYNLWVLSGLNYRQRFMSEFPENKIKKEEETQTIEQIKRDILNNQFYISLDSKNKKFFDERIKHREWQCYFDGINIKKAGFEDLAILAGMKSSMVENLYSYLSLSSHPSNVSVFQFRDLYKLDQDRQMTFDALELSKNFAAFAITDFAKTNKHSKKSFESLPETYQAFINMINSVFRSEEYSVNQIQKTF